MSIRVDTASLISGALVCGNRGLGIRGSQAPADSPLSHDTGVDPDKEYRYLVTTVPVGLSFFMYEDTSFIASANDGTYDVESETYEDGQVYGTKTTTLIFGASGTAVTGTLAATLDGVTMVASGQISVAGLFASTLDGVTLSASGAVAEHATGAFAATLAGARMNASGYLGDTPPAPPSALRSLALRIGLGL